MPSESDNAKTMQRLRRLARANGMPDIVCIEAKQLARLKTLAIAYLEKVVEESFPDPDVPVDPPTKESLEMMRAAAKKEIGQIRRAV